MQASGMATLEFTVLARDTAGQFISKLELAGDQLMEDLAEKAADRARKYAPVGTKNDPRTPHLKDAISSSSTATSATVTVIARHAEYIERGGGASLIPGMVNFFWEKEGRWWNPGKNIIQHPPTAAKPFMAPAYQDMVAEWREVARRYYPR